MSGEAKLEITWEIYSGSDDLALSQVSLKRIRYLLAVGIIGHLKEGCVTRLGLCFYED